MEIFMTGANGFVGLNIAAALLKRQHGVTAYVREGSDTTHLERLGGVRIVRGSLDHPRAVETAMCGAQAVIHTAGNTSCNRRDLPALLEANVRATQHIVDAAVVNGVSRIVYTSTTSTIGSTGQAARPADEDTPLAGFRARSPYARTKQQAEQIVRAGMERGVECIILNPAEVIGPFDHSLQWGRMVLAVYHDQVPFVPPGGGSFCSATEVGRAHVTALTRGRSGERYILGGENASYATFLETIAQVLGRSCRLPRTPYAWLYTKALLQDRLPAVASVLVPGKPAVEPYRMRVFAGTHYFDSSKAQRELGYGCPTLRQMLRECAGWYRRHGYFGTPAQQPLSTPQPTPHEARPAWIQER